MSRYCRVASLALMVLILTGCGSSIGSAGSIATPRPSVTRSATAPAQTGLIAGAPTPTAVPAAASAVATIRHFNQALITGDVAAAQHYLVPHFRPSCGGTPTSATAIACLQARPHGYLPLSVRAVYVKGNQASTAVVYQLPSGRVPRTISLVEERDGWSIASITEVQG